MRISDWSSDVCSSDLLGHDPAAERDRVVGRIGVMLQDGGVYPGIRPPEVLHLLAAMYDDPADPDALLERVGLADRSRRSEERRVGNECVRTVRSRWTPCH